jgi:NADH-quinone oxidoreductase subunit D
MDLPPEFAPKTREFIATLRSRLPMYRGLVTDNGILLGRCVDIGVLDLGTIRRYGATGR